MTDSAILCLPVTILDPCSRRIDKGRGPILCFPVSTDSDDRVSTRLIKVSSRRGFLKVLAAAAAVPALLGREFTHAEELLPKRDFVSDGLDPSQLWDGDRQLVFAYQQGEELGELCRKLDSAKDELPVSIIWKLPPDWVKTFPTIHFEVSSRRWKKFAGWRDPASFSAYYGQFNPPPKGPDDTSPYKEYAGNYKGGEWTYPGKIEQHLLDPKAPHRFSEYEIRGLSKQEMENLHSAHHEKLVEPGRQARKRASRTT